MAHFYVGRIAANDAAFPSGASQHASMFADGDGASLGL